MVEGQFQIRVISLDVPEDVLVRRLTGRRNCNRCGAIFNIHSAAPDRDGICDRCGGPLMQRDDDREETVRGRLRVYRNQTEPLVEWYRKQGLLQTVDGNGEIDGIFRQIEQVIQ
jgi:adenylate kinase